MTQKTVFVVGAGASTEFGPTPVGDKLARDIESQMIREFADGGRWPEGPISSAVASSGGLGDEHVRAMARIRDSVLACNSIDQFIYEWQDVPHLPEIAKLCIAYFIIEAERETSLASIRRGEAVPVLRLLEDSWLAIALANLNPYARRRDILDVLDGVSFITFNYDRCIEKYLRESFMSTYGMEASKAETAASSVPILHAYGDLGPLPKGAASGVEFGGPEFLIRQAARSIKTFMEEVASEHVGRIHGLLDRAEKIIFLGCAFHQQNIELLLPPGRDKPTAQVWGTTYGMRPAAIQRARGRLPLSPLILESMGCRDILKHHREVIFED